MTMPYLENNGMPVLLAHRGGNLATENTVEAFQAAESIGYHYIETDVQLTKDGVVVVFHDSGLNRLAGRPEYISDLTWIELKDIKLRGGGTIPRLSDVLEQFPDLKFNIEPKSDRAVRPLAAIIDDTNSIHRVCVGSFSGRRVREMQKILGPKLCTSPGISTLPWVLIRSVLFPSRPSRYGCVQAPDIFRPTRFGKWLIKRVQRAGLPVHIWTLNTSEAITRTLEIGVDGIITDEIELAQKLGSRPRQPETR